MNERDVTSPQASSAAPDDGAAALAAPSFRTLVELSRPFTLLAPMVGSVACACIAVRATGLPFPWLSIGAGMISALFATVASNYWNQAFDADIDRINKPYRPIPQGRITQTQARRLGTAAAAFAVAWGLVTTWVFLACVAVGLLATWIYSAPPLRTKRRPLGALFTIAVPRGLLVPVAGWSLVAPPTQPDPWWLGVIAFLYVLGAAATKDFGDIEGDRAHGCETLPVLLGPKKAARWLAVWIVVPFVVYVALAATHVLPASTLGVAAALLGGSVVVAFLLLRTAAQLERRPADAPPRPGDGIEGDSKPMIHAWIGMYLLMLALYVATALAYPSPQVAG